MNDEQVMQLRQIAVVNAAVARALIELESMKAFNAEQERHGFAPAYGENAFLQLIERNGIGHDAVINMLRP